MLSQGRPETPSLCRVATRQHRFSITPAHRRQAREALACLEKNSEAGLVQPTLRQRCRLQGKRYCTERSLPAACRSKVTRQLRC
jgi:hypothetical protein